MATTLNNDFILFSTGQTIGASSSATMKNRIINGDMRIDQRSNGGNSTVTSTGYYSCDRWQEFASQSSKYSIQQNAGGITPPSGFANYLGATSLSAYLVTSSDYFFLSQAIEGYNISDLAWGTSNAKTVTLSFWVYSSLTGTFGGSLRNSAATRSYPFSYTISVANTWTYITITIAGDTTGTWLINNSAGIQLAFSLGAGSTYSGTAGSWSSNNYVSATGATSVVGTSGATFYITGVQFEEGSAPTSFDYRPYGTELQLCQRYYSRILAGNVNASLGGVGAWGASTAAQIMFQYPVPMRTFPTFNQSLVYLANGVSGFPVTSINAVYTGQTTMQISAVASAATATPGQGAYLYAGTSGSAYVEFNAEL